MRSFQKFLLVVHFYVRLGKNLYKTANNYVWLCYLLGSDSWNMWQCFYNQYSKIVCSFPMRVSFPLFLYFYKFVFKYMVSSFHLFVLHDQFGETTCTPHHLFCVKTGDVTALCIAMVSCYSAAASMRKLHITRGSGAPGRQGWPDLHGELDGSVDGARRLLKQVETVISYISNKI